MATAKSGWQFGLLQRQDGGISITIPKGVAPRLVRCFWHGDGSSPRLRRSSRGRAVPAPFKGTGGGTVEIRPPGLRLTSKGQRCIVVHMEAGVSVGERVFAGERGLISICGPASAKGRELGLVPNGLEREGLENLGAIRDRLSQNYSWAAEHTRA